MDAAPHTLTPDRSPISLLQLDPPETKSPAPDLLADQVAASLSGLHATPGHDRLTLGQVFRHSGWARDRRRVYEALRDTHQSIARILAFEDCGSQAYVLRSRDDPPRYRVAGSACHDRFCRPCANARARGIALNVSEKLGKHPVRFLTLTVAGTGLPLADRLDHITRSFAALRRTAFWRQNVTGGIAFCEIKWSVATQRWHPHFHCLIEGRYLPKRAISYEWQKVTGDSKIVRIMRIPDAARVVGYITRYAGKTADHTFVRDPVRLSEAIRALLGRRLCTTFGRWRGIALTGHPSEEAWENIGTVHDVARLAAAGDMDCLRALAQIDAQATAITVAIAVERSPPVEEPPSQVGRQLKLFATHPYV